MKRKKLEIITERDSIIGLIKNKKNSSPIINNKTRSLPIKNSYRKNSSNLKEEDRNFINNIKTYYPLKSPIFSDSSKINPISTRNNLHNNTFLQNNLYKSNILNKSQYLNQNQNQIHNNNNNNNIDKINQQYTIKNFHSTRDSKLNNNNFNLTLDNLNKYQKKKDLIIRNFQSPQNQNTKNSFVFSFGNSLSEKDKDKENMNSNKTHIILSKLDDKKLSFSQLNLEGLGFLNLYSKSINEEKERVKEKEKEKVTNFTNEEIMNSTNKTQQFIVSPKVIKKENLINLSGIKDECNYYDFPNNADIPIYMENLFINYPGYETAKSSKKQVSDLIKSYAVNTYQGIIR
jgi:hypothetical protein